MSLKNISSVINFVGGMYLSGALGKISLAICAWASSYKKPFSTPGSTKMRVLVPDGSSGSPATRANCSFINWEARTVWASSIASAVVRVVIFSSVYNNSSKTVDNSWEKLVTKCSLHVYISK